MNTPPLKSWQRSPMSLAEYLYEKYKCTYISEATLFLTTQPTTSFSWPVTQVWVGMIGDDESLFLGKLDVAWKVEGDCCTERELLIGAARDQQQQQCPCICMRQGLRILAIRSISEAC
jgi:hypothetical protein